LPSGSRIDGRRGRRALPSHPEPIPPAIHQADLTRPGRRLDRIANAAATLLPALGLVAVAWQLWGSALHWQDLLVFVTMTALAGFGVTVGFHRLFTHRSFKTARWLRVL